MPIDITFITLYAFTYIIIMLFIDSHIYFDTGNAQTVFSAAVSISTGTPSNLGLKCIHLGQNNNNHSNNKKEQYQLLNSLPAHIILCKVSDPAALSQKKKNIYIGNYATLFPTFKITRKVQNCVQIMQTDSNDSQLMQSLKTGKKLENKIHVCAIKIMTTYENYTMPPAWKCGNMVW